jgi:hypothetical protein
MKIPRKTFGGPLISKELLELYGVNYLRKAQKKTAPKPPKTKN